MGSVRWSEGVNRERFNPLQVRPTEVSSSTHPGAGAKLLAVEANLDPAWGPMNRWGYE
jgi:hypothetical protein